MAGYQDDREHQYDAKYLRKMLGEIDRKIQIPDSVCGASLLKKLDNIELATPPSAPKRPLLSYLNWRSGLVYAAAFTLIITLFYGISADRQGLVDGNILLQTDNINQATQSQTAPAQYSPDQGTASPAMERQVPFAATPPEDDIQQAASTPSGGAFGVGGGSKATIINVWNEHTYAWRVNDKNDPDKAQFPISVDIVDTANSQLVSQIDIADMTEISKAFFEGEVMALVGEGESGAVTQLYNIANLENPLLLANVDQPFILKDAVVYSGYLSVVSLSDTLVGGETAGTKLPDSQDDKTAIITTINLKDGAFSQSVFDGVGGFIKLADGYLLLSFNKNTAGETVQAYNAKIKIDGLNVNIESSSEIKN